MKKRTMAYLFAAAALILILWGLWTALCAPTKIAFMNYQAISLGEISKANDSRMIRLYELRPSEAGKAGRYDMLFINGMGLRITEQEREEILEASRKGLPVVSTMVTNPANDINTLDSAAASAVGAYLENGGRANYRNMLAYVRRHVDGKAVFAPEPPMAEEYVVENIYRPSSGDEPEIGFGSIAEYEAYLRAEGLYRENASRIVVTGQMGEPSKLVESIEATGNMVYAIRSIRTFVTDGTLDSIAPSAIINMAHGRLGDAAVEYLESRNIPLFAPLNVNALVEDWEADEMGMSGGFLSQSVVTPEIDGAIRPYALFGHYLSDDGLQYLSAIPDRLDDFTETVNRYIALKTKPESEKKIAVFYFKGPGQNALTAGGMEVVPSLYNFLVALKEAGYDVGGLPSSPEALGRIIAGKGAVFGSYAQGASSRFMDEGDPLWIDAREYATWTQQALPERLCNAVTEANGDFPGPYMTRDGKLALACIRFGNVILMPQPAAGGGDNDFQMVHGTHEAPPHNYIAAYLYARYGFGADILVHFGTHGSLEFTPSKQVALSRFDWPDRLTGTLPHLYLYTIGNVGEGVIAKRRSYAGLQSYLTAPFTESGVRGLYRELEDALSEYSEALEAGSGTDALSLKIKSLVTEMGISSDLGLDTIPGKPYSADEVLRISNFSEELASEKVTGRLYVLGEAYEPEYLVSTVYAMCTDPVAYGLFAIDRSKGEADDSLLKDLSAFNRRYADRAKRMIGRILSGDGTVTDEFMRTVAGVSSMASSDPEFARSVSELETALKNVNAYRELLRESPAAELESVLNALDGGYVPPSPGGDPVANPNVLPTGRNLFAINAEATPTKSAWEKGVKLAENTIDLYRSRHGDSIPRKVSYTLWSSEFIETEGATVAQILYMLGVEPIYDTFGRVTDIRLIPSERLGRPRIDVVVQTSGQLRDIAASRLFLIDRAVKMAAAAKDDGFANNVAEGVRESERILMDKGVTPEQAREMSSYRVFGGVNGNYGTGIQGMVEASDRWDSEDEIAGTYLNNMGAYYGSEDGWQDFAEYAFEAALSRTDAVVQPRQSNTWGALSLDHVYEFMGGLNLAVREVTGKDPDAYLSDYRNRSRVRMQELKEAIGIESRTTIFNPSYIAEKMKGGAGDADAIAETVKNTFGWNVMKPSAVDDRMWNEIYDIYIEDSYGLGVREHFEAVNPAALEEMTAVMLESARKGLWNASDAQISSLAGTHADLVERFAPSCSGLVCDNPQLQDFISSNIGQESADEYKASIKDIREVRSGISDGTVLEKETVRPDPESRTAVIGNALIAVLVIALFIVGGLLIRRRRKSGL